MSCLAPQFRCPPETTSPHIRTYHNTIFQLLRSRRLPYFQAQCVLSTTSQATSTTVLDMEKLRLLSLEARSNPVASQRPWTYTREISPPAEPNYEVALETETLLASEDAVIAAAAAEAVALAKAAVKAARDAALMIRNNQNSENKHSTFLSEADTALLKKTRLRNTEIVGLLGESSPSETQVEKGHYDLEPTHDELELLQEKLSENIDARSKRLSERKAKRTRASEKAAAGFVPPKYGSTSRKKRAALQDIDYSDPLRYLRGTTSSTKLLTAAEEQEFSAGIQDLLKLEKVHEELEERYGGKPTFAQWAAALGVDQKTLNKRLNHGILCKEKMIKSNIRLVISIAKNYQNAGMSIQDLVQEGCRGLVRGAEKFDASKGFKFSTYAHWWIKQSVRKSLSDQSRTIRLPFHMVEATYKVKEARKQLYSENGRQPENEEVAEATGLSMKRLSTVLVTPKPPRSLDQKIGFNMNLKPSEVISDPAAETGEEQLIKQYMKQDLEKVLDSLSQRESQVVRLRFGMEDGRMKTLQEIGESMGVSRERIRQIESSAFRKLRNKKRIKPLQQYVVS